MAACEHGMPLTLGCDDCTIARLNKQRQDDEALIQRMLAALEDGHEAAAQVAADYHAAYKGHRPDTHAALDADVDRIAKAITAARARLEKAP